MYGTALGFALMLSATSARGQEPTVNVVPPLRDYILDVEQRVREEDRDEPVEFLLQWTVSGLTGQRDYRISYDPDDRATGTSTDTVNVVSPTQNTGPASATGSVRVSEDELIRRVLEESPGQEGSLSVFAMVFQPGTERPENFNPASWGFRFDFRAPDAPGVTRFEPGERTVRVEWSESFGSNLTAYRIVYCPGLSDEQVDALTNFVPEPSLSSGLPPRRLAEFPPCPDGNLRVEDPIGVADLSFRLTDGIAEDSWVALRVDAVDAAPFRNASTDGAVYAVRTEEQFDFFERQRALGGGEDGGFCFVATAAHGSYAHPVVGFLRGFRDQFLARVPFGRTFVRLYYQLSPPLAAAIDETPALGAPTRMVLLLWVTFLAVAGGLFFIVGGRMLWHRLRAVRRRAFTRVLLGVLGFGGAFGPATAQGQIRGDKSGDVGVAFEFKAGPFLPEVGNSVESGGLQAWSEVYGPEETTVLFNIGGELQIVREVFGTISIGGSLGFTRWEGSAQILAEDGSVSDGANGTSTFNLIPMTLTLGYRFDLLLDRTDVPLAPYIRGGLAYSLWWNTRDDGALSRFADGDEEREAIGGIPGFIGMVGIALALNGIDPQAAAAFRATTGIRTSYLFFEGQLGWVNGFGDDDRLDLSDVTWFGGLMLEI